MNERGPIALAEKVIALLEEGRFTATYKYAVLLAIMDLLLERTSRTGTAPDTLYTPQLAEKVVEEYWPHCVPYVHQSEPGVLLQNAARPGVQARIITDISRFRGKHASDGSASLIRARVGAPAAFERLIRKVEWTLIDMPLPRLQQFGHGYDPFLYDIAWGKHPPRGPVTAYQQGEPSDFDNRIQLKPGVGEYLVLLNGLLRPLIHREWARQVAQINGLPESRLEAFLFGANRVALEAVRPGLQEMQDCRCFYCGEAIGRGRGAGPAVDHFIPWSRYPNNAIENLVVAHDRCNGQKRDFLAASDHVQRWRSRVELGSRTALDLASLSADVRWESARERSLGVARGIYLNLPEDMPLWLRNDEFVELERDRLLRVLG